MLIVKIMNRYIFIGLLCFVIGACTHHTTGFYEGPRYLSFVNEKGADTAFISFANYPGASTHEVAFVLKQAGMVEGRIGVLDIGRVFIQKNGGVYLVHRGEYPGRGRTFCCQSVYLTI